MPDRLSLAREMHVGNKNQEIMTIEEQNRQLGIPTRFTFGAKWVSYSFTVGCSEAADFQHGHRRTVLGEA